MHIWHPEPEQMAKNSMVVETALVAVLNVKAHGRRSSHAALWSIRF